MLIRVVGKRNGVDFVTKDGVHIQGTSVFFLREARGVEGYLADKCFVPIGTADPFVKLNADYKVERNEYGKIDIGTVTLA